MSKECNQKECSDPTWARGMCSIHYRRHLRGADMDAPKRHSNKGEACTADSCRKRAANKGLCTSHHYRRTMGMDINYPPIRRQARGEWGHWFINGSGYVLRQRKLKGQNKVERQLQHRVVMEERLGRPLLKHENVHHRNGIRHDNRLENLELWSTSQPSGQRVEEKLAWAREIVLLYEGERTW